MIEIENDNVSKFEEILLNKNNAQIAPNYLKDEIYTEYYALKSEYQKIIDKLLSIREIFSRKLI